ncbi:hypothetical protein [Kineococcus radiotolerans]|uniref:Uncharacterized protein n=1 Tax=Kineococcus radiotolerans (strain ATCC BAA-149 / DSM 14245 / SRS30216) TaxID=266940 RepID=A6W8V0_KINRD|nr:hypothetical protein [Kineococcus radiotolerans]ABS03239.1 hypothetical protein Krad_1753 [Kineococcus radiotolerans SRS30216 = ATCC BAA-149]
MTEQPTPELTGAVRDLLKKLAWRDDMGPCYLVGGKAGRQVLVVPALRPGGPLSRLTAYADSTITRARDMGLVDVDTQHTTRIRFDYRQAGDGDHGRRITLTPTAWRALGHPHGRNPLLVAKEARP